MSESIFCEYCEKVLSQQKGEEDHGCLDCAGYIYIVNGVNVCFHCVENELKKLRMENDKMGSLLIGFHRIGEASLIKTRNLLKELGVIE